MNQYFRIVGSSRYLPHAQITSEELDARFGYSPGETEKLTGIRTRHQALVPETASSMACRVIREAMDSARLKLSDVDLLIDASLSIQQPIPCNAALIQEALGPEAAGMPAFDVHASCLGFLAALRVVNGLCASGSVRRAIIVCSETPLRGVNWDEPESASLMGDGAAAIVAEACPSSGACVFAMQTFGEGASLCGVEGGGHRLTPYAFTVPLRHRFQFHMEGKALHKMASRRLPPLVSSVLNESERELDSLEVIPHQASGPSIELIRRKLGISLSRLNSSISSHGNLVAAGIPYVLHAVRLKVAPGSPVLVVGTGAGYSQAAAIFSL
jgi:3-oxoacyl-[acyl-carrier-protein] synthase-3